MSDEDTLLTAEDVAASIYKRIALCYNATNPLGYYL